MSPKTASDSQAKEPSGRPARKRRVEDVWTPRLAKEGFTQISNYFLANYTALGLSGSEPLLLIHLLRYKWGKDEKPFPKYATLAGLMGLHHRRVRAIMSSLEKRGFIKRIERRRENDRSDSNQFDLAPLFQKLEELQMRNKK